MRNLIRLSQFRCEELEEDENHAHRSPDKNSDNPGAYVVNKLNVAGQIR